MRKLGLTGLLACLAGIVPCVATGATDAPPKNAPISAALIPTTPTPKTPSTTAPSPVPILQLADAGFPLLVMHHWQLDADGSRLPVACDQVRPRRLDELDPRWKRAVQRIHMECEPLPPADGSGTNAIATIFTAYLAPGAARFLESPVVEVRLMDSDLWSDHQFVLDAPYQQVVDAMQRHLLARCQAAQDDPAALARRDCALTRTDEGLFIDSSAVGGTWVHPDPHDLQRTVYAEAWAE